MDRQVVVVENTAALSIKGAELIAQHARKAIAERGRFVLALAGGSTVKAAYQLLAHADGIDWKRVSVFWGDERFVDQENPYSNYRLGRSALLDRAIIPARNIYAVDVTSPTPAEGAARYETTIREVVGGDGVPVFDLIQLGMGPDGHTASLFPNSSALTSQSLVAANHAGLAPWVDRVTFTLPLINAARTVLILAGGENKSAHIQQAIEGENADIASLPVAGVRPENGELIWVIDKAAAGELTATS